MKSIFEINPLECPRCKGTMRIIAFLTDEREILKIADSLRIPRAQSPPNIPRPPEKEFFDGCHPTFYWSMDIKARARFLTIESSFNTTAPAPFSSYMASKFATV